MKLTVTASNSEDIPEGTKVSLSNNGREVRIYHATKPVHIMDLERIETRFSMSDEATSIRITGFRNYYKTSRLTADKNYELIDISVE